SIFVTPAFAAPHDTLPDGTYAGTQTTTDSVVLCDLDVVETGGDPCFFGVIDTGGTTAAATVNAFTNGEVGVHHGSNAGYLSNDASAEFGAIAAAYNSAGNAVANAHLNAVLYQNSAQGTPGFAGDAY